MREQVINFVTVLGILGIPSIFAMSMWCIRKCVDFSKNLKILIEAQQKQMARDLTVDYKVYMDQGYIDDDDLMLWEENYQKYHALGANGIMDKKRERLLSLPNVSQ